MKNTEETKNILNNLKISPEEQLGLLQDLGYDLDDIVDLVLSL